MKFINSKIAIALSLIIAGNVVIQDFIEDDMDYNNTKLASGWGWLGINAANATMGCGSYETGTHCSISVDPCDVYDCNEDPFPPGDTNTPPGPGDDGGGSGGGTPAPPPTNPNMIDLNKDRINDCWKGLYGKNATGANLSSDWGWRVINNVPDFHPGWDIGTLGQVGVTALFMGDARIIDKGSDAYNGFWVSYELVTNGIFVKYIHLASLPTVNKGQVYAMGEVAGVIGKTGATNAIHLHLVTYPSKQAYDTAVAQKVGKSDEQKDMIDFNSSIDPASRFNGNVCPFPSSVKSSNNTKPISQPVKPPCSGCQIP